MTLSSQSFTDRGLRQLARDSHRIITKHQATDGAYPAAPTFSAYRGYAWLRDGSFVAEGVSRFGDRGSAERFHTWTAELLESRAEQVANLVAALAAGIEVPTDRMLQTRFRLDGSDGDDPWWNFQTDGYGTWLWAVVSHASRHRVTLDRWRPGIEVAVDYLAATWSLPCYDWWEEHVEHRHVSTLGAIHGGLEAVAAAGVLDDRRTHVAHSVAEQARRRVLTEGVTRGRAASPEADHLAKWLGTSEVDASLAACIVPFGLVTPGTPLAAATIEAIERDLAVDRGVHRFRADEFYGGGQWPLLSCLLGWNLAAVGDVDTARSYLTWAALQARPGGALPEQVASHLLRPDRQGAWEGRWGPVATPLLWSHGMYLILADELGLVAGDGA